MDPNSGKLYPSLQAAKDDGVENAVELSGPLQSIHQVSAAVSRDAARQKKSPYCVRCNKARHGGYNHGFHETSEHDAWWARVQKEVGSG